MLTGNMSPTTNNIADAFTGPQARNLRQRIHSRRRKLGWTEFMLHYIMDALGYGPQLRLLPDYRLDDLYQLLLAYTPPRPDGWDYTPESGYLCYLQHQAGWSDPALRAYLIETFQKTHLNLLDERERNSLADTLKQIIDPQGEPT